MIESLLLIRRESTVVSSRNKCVFYLISPIQLMPSSHSLPQMTEGDEGLNGGISLFSTIVILHIMIRHAQSFRDFVFDAWQ